MAILYVWAGFAVFNVERLSPRARLTVELGGTKLGTFPPLVLGGIIENQNSDFVMA
jgi:hypothetical protein